MKVSITPKQLEAIISMMEELDATVGSGEDDTDRLKWIKAVKRFLKKNNIQC